MESNEISRIITDIYKQIPFESKNEKKSQEKNVLDYLGFFKEEELKPYIKFDKSYPRLAFRMVASNTNERTLIFSLLPKNITYSHSMYAHIPKKYILKNKKIEVEAFSIYKVLFVNAVLNSLVLDYVSRFIIDINATKTYLMRLPVSNPTEQELKENKKYQKLILNTLKLTLSYNKEDFIDLQKEFNINSKDIPKNQKEIDILKIENDKIVANMYEVSKEDLKHITSVDYFKVFNEKSNFYIRTLLETYNESN